MFRFKSAEKISTKNSGNSDSHLPAETEGGRIIGSKPASTKGAITAEYIADEDDRSGLQAGTICSQAATEDDTTSTSTSTNAVESRESSTSNCRPDKGTEEQKRSRRWQLFSSPSADSKGQGSPKSITSRRMEGTKSPKVLSPPSQAEQSSAISSVHYIYEEMRRRSRLQEDMVEGCEVPSAEGPLSDDVVDDVRAIHMTSMVMAESEGKDVNEVMLQTYVLEIQKLKEQLKDMQMSMLQAVDERENLRKELKISREHVKALEKRFVDTYIQQNEGSSPGGRLLLRRGSSSNLLATDCHAEDASGPSPRVVAPPSPMSHAVPPPRPFSFVRQQSDSVLMVAPMRHDLPLSPPAAAAEMGGLGASPREVVSVASVLTAAPRSAVDGSVCAIKPPAWPKDKPQPTDPKVIAAYAEVVPPSTRGPTDSCDGAPFTLGAFVRSSSSPSIQLRPNRLTWDQA